MGYKISSYLFRNRLHRLYFRRRIPADISQYFSHKTLYKSLDTSERHEAVRRVAYLTALTEQAFERVRQMIKKKEDSLRTDLTMTIDLKELGSFKIEMEPHEVETGKQLIQTTIEAAKSVAAQIDTKKVSAFAQLLLSIVIEKYCRENEAGGNWSSASAKDYRGDFRQFVEIVGDQAIGAITREQIVTAKDKWLRLPANLKKMPALASKTVDEVLALNLPHQSAANVSKKWERVRAFFNWAQANAYVTDAYASKLKIKAKGRNYEAFTPAELVRLFGGADSKEAGFSEAFQYWVPLIGLFTGGRLEEIAQMHLSDIRLHGDRHFFHITLEADAAEGAVASSKKRLKNESSDRVCPVHRKLVELGLLTYIDDLKARGYDRLFPELRQDGGEKVGARAGEWFTKFRREKGVGASDKRSTKVFHSFRHTMNQALQALDVSQEYRERLCGHKSKSVNVSVYGGKNLDAQLIDAIDRLDYEMVFAPYRANEKHEVARQKANRPRR